MKKIFHRLAGLPAQTPRLHETAENRTAPMAADGELAGQRIRRGSTGLRMARKMYSTIMRGNWLPSDFLITQRR